ncbi:unnamed protein product [Moneuplotes crassus]|uniref:Pet127-domain-containing protein n=5 Tax=Euplotes crassus TaxID=5936 RepID=A0AAD1Y856_EUPCR|nr:unnamed protein product [Moneuplotes crassus]
MFLKEGRHSMSSLLNHRAKLSQNTQALKYFSSNQVKEQDVFKKPLPFKEESAGTSEPNPLRGRTFNKLTDGVHVRSSFNYDSFPMKLYNRGPDISEDINHLINSSSNEVFNINNKDKYALPQDNNHFHNLKDLQWDNANYSVAKDLDFYQHKLKRIENKYQSKDIIPQLANNLEKVMDYKGIFPVESVNEINQGRLGDYFLRLPQYSQIDESCIPPYYPPSQDKQLLKIAEEHGSRFVMSTSTITSVLAHMYFMISNFKSPHFANLSYAYDKEPLKFMISQRKPNSIFLKMIDPEKKIYAIDSDSGFSEPSNMVLLKMGKYMEKMLQYDAEEFRSMTGLKPGTTPQEDNEQDYFKYSLYNNILLRSQIDCRRVEADGSERVFEIKTRAAAVLRYDIENYVDYLGYQIIKKIGKHSSFEREYYDLIRGGFLRYIMQCKIGGMDGAFIAYHNTQKVFGFEYITLKEMEERIFGCEEYSNLIFQAGLKLIENVLDHILSEVGEDPNQVLKLGFYSNESKNSLDIFCEIMDDDKVLKDRTKSIFTENIEEPIDYYESLGIKPRVIKFTVGVYPIINGIPIHYSPILYEKGDTLDIKYTIDNYGVVQFNEYMTFLSEAYKSQKINIDNEYAGTWRFGF